MATKTYPYAVIWKGRIIPANTPIKIEEEKPAKKQRTRKAAKNNDNSRTN